MAVYEIQNKNTIAHLFDGWDETMIWSCLQGCMGIAYADSLTSHSSAQISVGGFCFFAGAASVELAHNRPANLQPGYAIFVPQSPAWEAVIERAYGERALRHVRYATKKEAAAFDKERLQRMAARLPARCELKPINHALYEEIRSLDWACDLCANYESYEAYRTHGLGFVVMRDGEMISGASSYTFYLGGIEIEIDTREDARRQGLATACGARLILECLERGLYPSWDAHNKESLALAEKLGYHFDRAYPVYEVEP